MESSTADKRFGKHPSRPFGITKHGEARTKTYAVWGNMLYRCETKTAPAYFLYGGRGISVCLAWHSYEHFVKDMGHKPEGLSLDRINNNGNYEPGNCRWATSKEQSANKRLHTMRDLATGRFK